MDSNNSPSNPCIACGARLVLFGVRLTYQYHRCRSCKTLQLSPMPTTNFLEIAYAEQYAQSGHYASDPDQSDWANAPFYEVAAEIVGTRTPQEGKILDVGCGWASLAQYLDPKRYMGVEYSKEMVAYAQNLGIQVREGGLESFQGESSKFSAIVCLSLFEHLVDFDGFLQNIRRLLLPEGVFIILSPTASFAYGVGRLYQALTQTKELPEFYQLFCPPWHTVLFSLKGLERMLESRGFQVVDIQPAPCGRAKGTLGILKSFGTWVGSGGSF